MKLQKLVKQKLNFASYLKRLAQKPKAFFYLSSIIILISYFRPIFTIWAYSDEYDFFEPAPKLGSHMSRDGHLLAGFVYENFSATLVDMFGELYPLRLMSFLFLYTILNHVSTRILLQNQNRSIQFLLPIGLTLPTSLTFISWGLIWQGSLAMLIGYFANVMWLKLLLRFRLIAVLMLVISMLMSPVAAFSVFGFQALIFFFTQTKAVDYFKQLLGLVVFYGISGVVSLACMLITLHFNDLELNERVGTPSVSDLPKKAYWLVSRPIVVSMRFFDISSPSTVQALGSTIIVCSVLLWGFKLQSRILGESVFERTLLFSGTILLSITPIAVTWSNQIEFRYLFGPSIALFTVTAFVILSLIPVKRIFQRNVYLSVLISIMLIGVSTMNMHVNNQFIDPFQSKNAFLESQVLKCKKENRLFEKIAIVQPTKSFPSRNNIGMFSQSTDLASPWVPVPSVKYVLKRLELPSIDVGLVDSLPDEIKQTCVIDLNLYRQSLVQTSK